MNKSLLKPRLNNGVAEFPVHHMRGGTSTGLVLWDEFLPENLELREELLRHLMGVPLSGPLKGNRQITGLGRGTATSNKVFIVKGGRDDPTILETTFAQLASDHGNIDWSVNCGNMSSALPLWAADTGFITVKPGEEVDAAADRYGRCRLDEWMTIVLAEVSTLRRNISPWNTDNQTRNKRSDALFVQVER